MAAVQEPKKYFQLDGNEEGVALAAKHGLKVFDAWNDPSAPWLARPVSFNENVRVTQHNILWDGLQVGDQGLRVMWFYRTVKEDRGYLPGTNNPLIDPPFAVGFDISTAETGIQIDAQTGAGGPAYRIWIEGSFRKGKVTSYTVTSGAVDDHITTDVVWEIVRNPFYVGDYFKDTPIPVAPGTPPVSAEALAIANNIIKEGFRLKELLAAL